LAALKPLWAAQPALDRLELNRRILTMTDPASAIKREVSQLVELQIQAFRQDSSLTPSELLQYRMRAEKIRILYQELDRIGRRRFEQPLRRAS
jgi:hypothetical protein